MECKSFFLSSKLIWLINIKIIGEELIQLTPWLIGPVMVKQLIKFLLYKYSKA